jgi:hypothetical protein
LSKLLNIATRVESVQCSLYRLRIPQYAVRARHCICYIAHFPSPSSRNPIARRCSNYREKGLLAQSGVIPCRVKHWCGRARGPVCTRISRRRNGDKRRKRRLPESPGEAQRRLRADSRTQTREGRAPSGCTAYTWFRVASLFVRRANTLPKISR